MSDNRTLAETIDYNFTNHTPTADGIRRIESQRSWYKSLANNLVNHLPACDELDKALAALEVSLFHANAAIARNETEDAK